MSEEDAFLHTTKIQATHRRRLHNISEDAWSKAWCSSLAKASFPSQRIYGKIQAKGIYTSTLARFQNDETFHASQLEHNWTEEWCRYLDYIRTIDVTHNVSRNNENDTPRCVIFDTIQNIRREAL